MRKMIIQAAMTGLLAAMGTGTATAQARTWPAPYGQPAGYNVQCERQAATQQSRGALAGALIGGLLGGAIGNNIDNDRYYSGYGRHGRFTVRERRSNSGQVAAGAAIGALAGAVAGSQAAQASSARCQTAYPAYPAYPHDRGDYAPDPVYGSIPRTTDGLYGGEEIMRSPPSVPPLHEPGRGDPSSERGEAGTETDLCRSVYSETRLPDGRIAREPAMACRNELTGLWELSAPEELYGY